MRTHTMAALASILSKLSNVFGGLHFPSGFPSFPVDEDFGDAYRRAMERDYQALAGDWEQVGKDMRKAMGTFYTYHMDDEQKAQLLEILEANPDTRESVALYEKPAKHGTAKR